MSEREVGNVVDDMDSAQKLLKEEKSIQRGAKKEGKQTLSSQFGSALMAFAPQLGGLLGDVISGGGESGNAGVETGIRIADQIEKQRHNMAAEEAQANKLKASKLLTNKSNLPSSQWSLQNEDGSLAPVIPKGGVFYDGAGNIVDSNKLVNIQQTLGDVKEGGKDSRQRRRLDFKLNERGVKDTSKFISSFNNDITVKDAVAALNMVTTFKQMVSTDSELLSGFGPRTLARLAGEVGMMTEGDVSAFRDKKIKNQIVNAIKERTLGGLSKATRDIYLKTITLLENRQRDILQRRKELFSGQFSNILDDVTADQGMDILEGKENVLSGKKVLPEGVKAATIKSGFSSKKQDAYKKFLLKRNKK